MKQKNNALLSKLDMGPNTGSQMLPNFMMSGQGGMNPSMGQQMKPQGGDQMGGYQP